MATKRLLAGLTLTAGLGGSAAALPPAPKADDLARTQPTIPGVVVTTPAPADLARCRVENVPGAGGAAIGHVLLDAQNRPVRRFLAVGTPNYNIMSFYLDGQEVYRETDSNGNGKPDQYRWLGAHGSKWGMDPQETGRVTSWARISPEEISKELFEAIQAKDAKRIDALVPTADELKALGLPAGEVARIQQKAAGAAARLNATAAAMALTDKAKWVHVELVAPQTTPGDAFGSKEDLVKHRNAAVLVDKGDGKAEFFQTGELLQVNNTWRVIDGPAPGSPTPEQPGGAADATPPVPDIIKDEVKELVGRPEPQDAAGVVKYQQERAVILEKIVAKLQGNGAQGDWLKQLLEAYGTAAEGGAKDAADRLAAWKGQIDKNAPKSPLAGFATFRVLGAEYAGKMRGNPAAAEVAKAQTWWKDALEAYVKDYPAGEETAEAMFRLAMAHEFGGKDGEAAAKQWYAKLAKDFPQNQLAPQATGAVRRLDLEGQPFALTGPALNGGGEVNVGGMAGKVVIVYYWASWSGQLKAEAQFLNELLKKHAGKGLEVVTVGMDTTPKQAADAVNAVQLPGQHVFQPNGTLTAQFGVMGPHIFLVGKDGKVANKNASVPSLGDEVEKLLK